MAGEEEDPVLAVVVLVSNCLLSLAVYIYDGHCGETAVWLGRQKSRSASGDVGEWRGNHGGAAGISR